MARVEGLAADLRICGSRGQVPGLLFQPLPLSDDLGEPCLQLRPLLFDLALHLPHDLVEERRISPDCADLLDDLRLKHARWHVASGARGRTALDELEAGVVPVLAPLLLAVPCCHRRPAGAAPDEALEERLGLRSPGPLLR